MYFDAHTHLNTTPLFENRTTYLTEFQKIGGTWLMNIWMDDAHNRQAIHIAKEAKKTHQECFVWATVWIHPCEVSFGKITEKKHISQEIKKLKILLESEKESIYAIGECWIDSHHKRDSSIESLQRDLFIAQCDLARETNLPVVIHSRSNYSLTHEILKEYTDLQIYLHCWGYWVEEVQQALQTFPHLWIWFCWNLTYPKAIQIQESLAYLISYISASQQSTHDQHILLETDAPYLSPQKVRGTKNNPAHILHIYERIQRTHPTYPIKTSIEDSFKKLYKLT